MYTTFRQVSSSTPTLEHDRSNLSPRYLDKKGQVRSTDTNNQLDQDRRNAKTIVQPQPPTFVRDTLDYTERKGQLYPI